MTTHMPARFWTRGRALGAGLAGAVVVLFAGANIHLISVSIASQPGCVSHLKAPQLETPKEGAAVYRAAKPSC